METPFIFEHKTFEDSRGNFCAAQLNQKSGNELMKNWVQVNTSISLEPYTIRGLHYQEEPFEQAKYLKVVWGKIYNMVVCVNKFSHDFGMTYVFEVDKDHATYVPRGYANGLITLEPNTVIQYFVDNSYSPEHEKSMKYDSVKDFRIMVSRLTDNPIISEKDANGIDFAEITKNGTFQK